MQTYGLTPSSPASGLSPYFYDFPALLESNPTLTDFYNFRQHSMNGQLSFIGSAEQKTYLGLGKYVAVMPECAGFLLKDFSLKREES